MACDKSTSQGILGIMKVYVKDVILGEIERWFQEVVLLHPLYINIKKKYNI